LVFVQKHAKLLEDRTIKSNHFRINLMKSPNPLPSLVLLDSPDWTDYELLDSGGGKKLERYGPYRFVRPEHQAIWKPALSEKNWQQADAAFLSTGEESGGHWKFNRPIEQAWTMRYKELRFQAQANPSRHLGVFPEQAAHWDWIQEQIHAADRPARVLNLFGYTGLATLAAAQAGAQVTHVDASKKAIEWARANQALSALNNRPIRWLVDDAEKFVRREVRRGSRYDAIILDPPKFGRGPAGQVWEFFESLPELLDNCRMILSDRPLFVLMTAYAIRASALSIHYALAEALGKVPGKLTTGELVLREHSAGRLLSLAIFSRWQADH
jgi:23S rRNA (cytosine1962-C5)-methyltransferase